MKFNIKQTRGTKPYKLLYQVYNIYIHIYTKPYTWYKPGCVRAYQLLQKMYAFNAI